MLEFTQCPTSKMFSSLVQGDLNQNLPIQMVITQQISIFDAMLVKPKYVLKVYVYFDFSAICLHKHILALPTLGQKCIFKNAYLLSYSHLNWQILIWVTLLVLMKVS